MKAVPRRALTDAQDAFGHAVWDHHHRKNAFEIIERSDGRFDISSGPAAYLADEPAFWGPQERAALAHRRNRRAACSQPRAMPVAARRR